jgi:Protein of unknown function (DUF3592)
VDAVRTIFLVIGICWLAFGVYGTVKQYRTRDWLRVRGRVFSSAAEQPHGRTTAWMHVVLYDYTFRETRYHGEHVFRQTANYRWRVKSIAQRYTAGDLIDVFVNTSDPEESTLFAGIQPVDLFMDTVPPLVLIVVAIYGVF